MHANVLGLPPLWKVDLLEIAKALVRDRLVGAQAFEQLCEFFGRDNATRFILKFLCPDNTNANRLLGSCRSRASSPTART